MRSCSSFILASDPTASDAWRTAGRALVCRAGPALLASGLEPHLSNWLGQRRVCTPALEWNRSVAPFSRRRADITPALEFQNGTPLAAAVRSGSAATSPLLPISCDGVEFLLQVAAPRHLPDDEPVGDSLAWGTEIRTG